MVTLYIRILILLIKSLITVLRPILIYSLIRGALKNRNKMGEISNPCGVPVYAKFILLISQFKISKIPLSVRKLFTYSII